MGPCFFYTIFFLFSCSFVFCFSFNLTIMHTNDVHGRFEETNKYSGVCRKKDKSDGKCFGGTARLMSEIKKIKNVFPNSILLDAGDQYTGTLWFYKYGGNVSAKFMNILGYDAMAFGNHEFDRGIKGLLPFLDIINFTVVNSNINASKKPELLKRFSTRHVISVGGERIGIVGYTTPYTAFISSPGPNLLFNPEIASLQTEVDALEKEGVNKIIALGHSGFFMDKEIAKNVRGLDVVVGGHTNTFLYTGTPPSIESPAGEYPYVVIRDDVSKVLSVQDYAYAKYLGFLHLNFDSRGIITEWNGNRVLLDKTIKQDPDVLAEMEPFRQGVINETKETIGKSQVFLEGNRSVCRAEECNIGNLITDGMIQQNLKNPVSEEWTNVSISVINSGRIRSSIEQGDISVGEVLNVLPFRNTVDLIELKGIHLSGMLEHSISRYTTNLKDLFGGFLQVSGIRVTYDISKPVGKRVVRVKVRCSNCSIPKFEDLHQEKVYKILLPSFIANGNDSHSIIKKNKIKHILLGEVDHEVFIGYIKYASPIVVGLEERITILSGSDNCIKWNQVNLNSAGRSTHILLVLSTVAVFVFVIMQTE